MKYNQFPLIRLDNHHSKYTCFGQYGADIHVFQNLKNMHLMQTFMKFEGVSL